MRKINVAHIASHKINVGDGAIHNGLYRTLKRIREKHSIDFDIKPIDAVEYAYTDTKIPLDEIASEHDWIIVGGGGVIDGYDKKDGSALGYPIANEDLKNCKSHVTLLALGHNLFYGQGFDNIINMNRLIEICNENSYGFSLRRDGSLERMSDLFDTSTMVEVPDPGMFVDSYADNKLHTPALADILPVIVLQLTSEKFDLRFGSGENTDKFFDVMAQLVSSPDYAFLLATHTANDIYAASGMMMKLEQPFMRYNVGVTGIYAPLFAKEYFGSYLGRTVVGMRGHAVICAFGLRCNLLAIDTHPKVRGFMKAYGLEDFCFTPYEVINDIGFTETLFTFVNNPDITQLSRLETFSNELEILESFLVEEVNKVVK